jgi:hypothetical protein
MLKNISKLECIIGEKPYQFLCEMDSPLSDVQKAIQEFQNFVNKIEETVKEEQAKLALEEKEKLEKSNG